MWILHPLGKGPLLERGELTYHVQAYTTVLQLAKIETRAVVLGGVATIDAVHHWFSLKTLTILDHRHLVTVKTVCLLSFYYKRRVHGGADDGGASVLQEKVLILATRNDFPYHPGRSMKRETIALISLVDPWNVERFRWSLSLIDPWTVERRRRAPSDKAKSLLRLQNFIRAKYALVITKWARKCVARRKKALKEVKLIFIPFKMHRLLFVWFLISGAQEANARQFEREERRVEEYKKNAEIMTKWARSALIRKRYQLATQWTIDR